jgi:hypothetical protein
MKLNMHKNNQSGFALLYPLLAILAILIIGIVGFKVYELSKNSQMTPNTAQKAVIDPNDPFVKRYSANCPDVANVTLTNTPIATDQIRYIEPMGKVDNQNVVPTPHAYIWPVNPSAADNSYNVVMPADGRVVSVSTDSANNHQLVLALSCRYYAIVGGIHQLASKILTDAGPLVAGKEVSISVPLSGGEPLGQVGGTAIEWSLIDVAKTNPDIITPSLYDSDPWIAHVLDPIGSFKSQLGKQLAAKSLHSSVPTGGKIDFDKKRTLQGNWFQVGTKGYQGIDKAHQLDGHLSLAPDYIDPIATVVSIGNWQGKPAQFIARGDVNPNHATKNNSPVKYELLPLTYDTPDSRTWVPKTDGFVKGLKASQRGQVMGTILVQVQDNETIKAELFPGKTGVQVTNFTAAAISYER